MTPAPNLTHDPNSILERMIEKHFGGNANDPIRASDGTPIMLDVQRARVVRPDAVDESARLSQGREQVRGVATPEELEQNPFTWLNVLEVRRQYVLGGGNAGGGAWDVEWEIKLVGRYDHCAVLIEQLPARLTRPYRDDSGWTIMHSRLVSEEGLRRENVRTAAAYGVSFRFESMMRATHLAEFEPDPEPEE